MLDELDQDLSLALQEPGNGKFQALFAYWESKKSADGRVLRSEIDPIDVGALLPNVFLVEVIREPRLRFLFKLVGTAIYDLEGNLTGTHLDELDPAKVHLSMHRHYTEACAGRLYIRHADLGWLGKGHTEYRVLLLPLDDAQGHVCTLLGLADYQVRTEPDWSA